MTDILVPQLGESVTEATVAKWLKKPGDAVKKDEPLVELETDKVSIEAPAPADGVLKDIVAEEGATVGIGAVLGRMDAGDAPAAAKGDGGAAKAAPAPAKDEAGGSGETVEVTVPQMGESVAEGSVSTWLKNVGDSVAADEPIVEIETDKVAVEVPAPVAGVIASHEVAPGDTVEVGSVIAKITAGASAAAKASAPAASAPASAAPATTAEPGGKQMPAARRVIAEEGLDASKIQGTGKDGRITKADAMGAAASGTAKTSTPAAPAPGVASTRDTGPREERVPMTRLRQTIARRLKEAQDTAAMLTTFNDVDMSAVMEMRKKYKDLFEKKHGVRLGFMGFFVKAVIQALKDVPAVNAEIDGTDLIYKNYYDIGVAVGGPKGLVVPVVRDADQLSLGGVEMGIGELARKARDNELSIADMQGATFTISNGGVYGSLMSTPILNAPQSGILGMHRIEDRPVVRNGQVVIRPMMYLALSYDHRIVDGKEAVTFLVRIKESIEDPERLVLDL